jgi:hypothetical protein
MQKKPVFYTFPSVRRGAAMLRLAAAVLLAAGLLFASCANAVNSHGGSWSRRRRLFTCRPRVFATH